VVKIVCYWDYEANKVIQLKPFEDVITNTLIESIPDSWVNAKLQTSHGSNSTRSALSDRSARSARSHVYPTDICSTLSIRLVLGVCY
jgi:hypothetical protein